MEPADGGVGEWPVIELPDLGATPGVVPTTSGTGLPSGLAVGFGDGTVGGYAEPTPLSQAPTRVTPYPSTPLHDAAPLAMSMQRGSTMLETGARSPGFSHWSDMLMPTPADIRARSEFPKDQRSGGTPLGIRAFGDVAALDMRVPGDTFGDLQLGAASSFVPPQQMENPAGILVGLGPGPGLARAPLSAEGDNIADFWAKSWNNMVSTGAGMDRTFVLQEAARRKQDIDRSLDLQLAELEDLCQQRRAKIQLQAEHHTRLAERKIEEHKRHYISHVTRQAMQQAYEISQLAEAEKRRLGEQAFHVIAHVVEQNKAGVVQNNAQVTEAMYFGARRDAIQQAQGMQQQISMQAQRRAEQIEQQARQALSSIYFPATLQASTALPA